MRCAVLVGEISGALPLSGSRLVKRLPACKGLVVGVDAWMVVASRYQGAPCLHHACRVMKRAASTDPFRPPACLFPISASGSTDTCSRSLRSHKISNGAQLGGDGPGLLPA